MGKTTVEFEIDDSVLEALNRIAARMKKQVPSANIADALTKAVATTDFLAENADEGKVLVRKGETLREVAIE